MAAAQRRVRGEGHRLYDWALVDIDETRHPRLTLAADPSQPAHQRAGVLPRPRTNTGSLAALVRVAGRRWTVEESFQTGKGLAGLDEHRVRRWTSWHRWSLLAVLAHAFLAVIATVERTRTRQPRGLIPLNLGEIRHLFTSLHSWHRWSLLAVLAHAFLAVIAAVERTRTRQPRGLIPLNLGEIRHLFTSLHNRRPHDPTHLLHGSRWRRRHQARARASHYRRQAPRSHDHDLRLEY